MTAVPDPPRPPGGAGRAAGRASLPGGEARTGLRRRARPARPTGRAPAPVVPGAGAGSGTGTGGTYRAGPVAPHEGVCGPASPRTATGASGRVVHPSAVTWRVLREAPRAAGPGPVRRIPVGWLLLLGVPAGFGATVPALLGPELAAGLGVAAPATAWVTTGFGWGLGVGAPLLARTAHRRGARAALLAGAALLLAGTVLLFVWPAPVPAVAGRALQGLGSAGLVTVALALAGTVTRLGLVGSGIAAGAALAPPAGALLADAAPWRAVLMLTAVSLLAVPVVAGRAPGTGAAVGDLPGGSRGSGGHAHHRRDRLGPRARPAPADRAHRPSRSDGFDGLGAALLAGAVAAVVCAGAAPVVAGAVLLVTGMLLAGWVRARPDGFVPLALLRRPEHLWCGAGAFVTAAALFAVSFAAYSTTAAVPVVVMVTGAAATVPALLVAFLVAPAGRLRTPAATGGPSGRPHPGAVRVLALGLLLGGAVGSSLAAHLSV
ncbi:MFS transporter [Streptomyces sp. NPDC051567]|uniref:MFS transporter n=1 Tax=Streptomyces sp. NPDC051567 TaxID=3365660 RepID=UPI0037A1F6D7